jgi:hypothetical protein
MKLRFSLLTILSIAILFACEKKGNGDDIDYPQTPLNFISLVASDTIISVSDIVTITATAEGDEVVYTWTPAYGNILGSGSVVQWTVCHADMFKIACEVTDKHGAKQSKSVTIHVKP